MHRTGRRASFATIATAVLLLAPCDAAIVDARSLVLNSCVCRAPTVQMLMEGQPRSPSASSSSPSSEQQQQLRNNNNFCTSCGAQLVAGWNFCANCGAHVPGPGQAAPTPQQQQQQQPFSQADPFAPAAQGPFGGPPPHVPYQSGPPAAYGPPAAAYGPPPEAYGPPGGGGWQPSFDPPLGFEPPPQAQPDMMSRRPPPPNDPSFVPMQPPPPDARVAYRPPRAAYGRPTPRPQPTEARRRAPPVARPPPIARPPPPDEAAPYGRGRVAVTDPMFHDAPLASPFEAPPFGGVGGSLLGAPLPLGSPLGPFLGGPLFFGGGGGPLFGGMASALAEGRAETDALLRQAESACRGDARVTALLGSDVTIGGVFGGDAVSVNGRKRLQVEVSLSGGGQGVGQAVVRGESAPRGGGGGGGGGGVRLASLQVRAAGQVIDVQVAGGAAAGGGRGATSEVIDVESH